MDGKKTARGDYWLRLGEYCQIVDGNAVEDGIDIGCIVGTLLGPLGWWLATHKLIYPDGLAAAAAISFGRLRCGEDHQQKCKKHLSSVYYYRNRMIKTESGSLLVNFHDAYFGLDAGQQQFQRILL